MGISSSSTAQEQADTDAKKVFTLDEIRKHNGIARETIYLSVDKMVFDVTSGKWFYGPKGWYGLFAGHDITYCLATHNLKKQNLDRFDVASKDFTKSQKRRLKQWKTKFLSKYKLVGTLQLPNDTNLNTSNQSENAISNDESQVNDSSIASVDVDGKTRWFTLEELHEYDGTNAKRDNLVYLCVDGVVFDVTQNKDNYGPKGAYSLFCGNDITYNLATGSLKKEDLNKFDFDISDFNERQRKSLRKWKEFFQGKYTVVGKLIQTKSAKSKL